MSLLSKGDKCPLGVHVPVNTGVIEPAVMSTYCIRKCKYNRSSAFQSAYTHLAGSVISCSALKGGE